jgi:hypothetical protein
MVRQTYGQIVQLEFLALFRARATRYSIKVRGVFPYPETSFRDHGKTYVSEGSLRSRVEMITKEEIIHNFLEYYKNHASE